MSMDETINTIVIGGGQAGLAAGYFLAERGENFFILDENPHTGEAWRNRMVIATSRLDVLYS